MIVIWILEDFSLMLQGQQWLVLQEVMLQLMDSQFQQDLRLYLVSLSLVLLFPAGSGVLTNLTVSGGEPCLDNLVLSAVGGSNVEGEYVDDCLNIVYNVAVPGCTDIWCMQL